MTERLGASSIEPSITEFRPSFGIRISAFGFIPNWCLVFGFWCFSFTPCLAIFSLRMAFKDFPKQVQGIKLLQRSLERGRLAHAYLFTGPAQIGSQSTRKEGAKRWQART